jgi:EAL domain-containing protein (putative c-di-GMP-specific phosphodiesterase class I)
MTDEQEPHDIANRLVAALQGDEFVLYAQSIIPLLPGSDEWPFQEIFVRFAEEDAKLLPPGMFLPVLEEFKLLPYLDRWVVNRLARWVRSGLSIKPEWHIPRSNVNLSSTTLLDPGYGEYVRKYAEDSYLSNGVLAFEVAWDDVTGHTDAVRLLMEQLRPCGCGFTLSGFDGAKASFQTLESLAPDFVKISPVIGAHVHDDPAHAERVAEISHRCHVMGIKTIAEQVESSVALEKLRGASIDFAQGFGIAPVKAL